MSHLALEIDLTGDQYQMRNSKSSVYRSPKDKRAVFSDEINFSELETVREGIRSSIVHRDGFAVEAELIPLKRRTYASFIQPEGEIASIRKDHLMYLSYKGFGPYTFEFLRPMEVPEYVAEIYIPRQDGLVRFVDRSGYMATRDLYKQDLLVLRLGKKNPDNNFPAIIMESNPVSDPQIMSPEGFLIFTATNWPLKEEHVGHDEELTEDLKCCEKEI